MAIDPQAQAHIDIAAGHASEDTRAWAARPPVVSPELPSVMDMNVPAPDGPVPVRVYMPPAGSMPLPVTIWIHGGGWVQGSIETNDTTCRFLAVASESIIVSVDYRLSPMTKFPGATEDCYAVAKWVMTNAPSFGGDASRTAIAGASAGGNLAAAVTLMARDRAGASRREPHFVHQFLVYPVMDFAMNTESYTEFAVGFGLDQTQMAGYWGDYLRDEADRENPYAAPLRTMDLAGLPPAHVITAENDVLRDEGETYAARLAAAGVPVRQTRYAGMIHTFFNGAIGFDKTYEAINEGGAELRKAFGTA
jgi:acetyl esterase